MPEEAIATPPKDEADAAVEQTWPTPPGPRLLRVRGLLVALPCWALLAVAAGLSPRANGFGTHTQLGLPACDFLAKTGWPCPSCGLTTSVADMAHGRPLSAWRAHPFGVLLFVMAAVLALAGTAEVIAGRSVLSRLGRPRWWVLTAVAGLVVGYGVCLLSGWADGSWPAR